MTLRKHEAWQPALRGRGKDTWHRRALRAALVHVFDAQSFPEDEGLARAKPAGFVTSQRVCLETTGGTCELVWGLSHGGFLRARLLPWPPREGGVQHQGQAEAAQGRGRWPSGAEGRTAEHWCKRKSPRPHCSHVTCRPCVCRVCKHLRWCLQWASGLVSHRARNGKCHLVCSKLTQSSSPRRFGLSTRKRPVKG